MRVKFVGMILLASFTGIILNPELLAASDSIKISDLDQSNIVETIPVAPAAKKPVAAAPAAPKAGVAEKSAPVAAKTVANFVQNQIQFAFGTQKIVSSSTAATDAGNNAVKVGKMIYGHDYTSFGKITKLNIGDVFSVTINGVTKKYRVAPNPIDGARGVRVKVVDVKKGEVYHEKLGNFYTSALERGWKHDLVLLTCHDGGRYIVVADEI